MTLERKEERKSNREKENGLPAKRQITVNHRTYRVYGYITGGLLRVGK